MCSRELAQLVTQLRNLLEQDRGLKVQLNPTPVIGRTYAQDPQGQRRPSYLRRLTITCASTQQRTSLTVGVNPSIYSFIGALGHTLIPTDSTPEAIRETLANLVVLLFIISPYQI